MSDPYPDGWREAQYQEHQTLARAYGVLRNYTEHTYHELYDALTAVNELAPGTFPKWVE